MMKRMRMMGGGEERKRGGREGEGVERRGGEKVMKEMRRGGSYSCERVVHEALEVVASGLLRVLVSLVDAMIVEGELEENSLDDELCSSSDA